MLKSSRWSNVPYLAAATSRGGIGCFLTPLLLQPRTIKEFDLRNKASFQLGQAVPRNIYERLGEATLIDIAILPKTDSWTGDLSLKRPNSSSSMKSTATRASADTRKSARSREQGGAGAASVSLTSLAPLDAIHDADFAPLKKQKPSSRLSSAKKASSGPQAKASTEFRKGFCKGQVVRFYRQENEKRVPDFGVVTGFAGLTSEKIAVKTAL